MNRWIMPVLAAGVVAAGVALVRAEDTPALAPAPTAAPGAGDANPAAAPAPALSAAAAKAAQEEKVSYALGALLADSIKTNPDVADLHGDALDQGFHDMVVGKCKYTREELRQIKQDWLRVLSREISRKNAEAAPVNKRDADAFLVENKKKEGVKVTASGLQYKVIKEGTGKSPKTADTVQVRYRGTLTNGTVFDATERHEGQDVDEFQVFKVIPGWTEGLQLMKEGGKYQFVIPPDLAYGETPDPRSHIPPNATLIFEVELVKVK